jgi:hypothetical protein
LTAWAIPIPSPETLDFLGELRDFDGTAWRQAFRGIRRRPIALSGWKADIQPSGIAELYSARLCRVQLGAPGMLYG